MFNPKDFDIVTDDFEVSAVQKFDTDCYVKLFTDEKLMKNIGGIKKDTLIKYTKQMTKSTQE